MEAVATDANAPRSSDSPGGGREGHARTWPRLSDSPSTPRQNASTLSSMRRPMSSSSTPGCARARQPPSGRAAFSEYTLRPRPSRQEGKRHRPPTPILYSLLPTSHPPPLPLVRRCPSRTAPVLPPPQTGERRRRTHHGHVQDLERARVHDPEQPVEQHRVQHRAQDVLRLLPVEHLPAARPRVSSRREDEAKGVGDGGRAAAYEVDRYRRVPAAHRVLSGRGRGRTYTESGSRSPGRCCGQGAWSTGSRGGLV